MRVFLWEAFLSTLKDHRVSLLVDVRSSPFSAYRPEYNQEPLENRLRDHGIYYRNYAHEFGARQNDQKYYAQEGYLDFELFSKSDVFLSGVAKLCESMRRGYTFALMCAEKNPVDCHRAILVSRAFYERGYPVVHIMPDGASETQEDLNRSLIDQYFPNRNQLSLLEEPQDDATLLQLAYRRRNAEIGYRMEDT